MCLSLNLVPFINPHAVERERGTGLQMVSSLRACGRLPHATHTCLRPLRRFWRRLSLTLKLCLTYSIVLFISPLARTTRLIPSLTIHRKTAAFGLECDCVA